MRIMNEDKRKLFLEADRLVSEYANEITELGKAIFQTPETAFQEHRTSALAEEAIKKYGFAVERGTGVLATALRAEKNVCGN